MKKRLIAFFTLLLIAAVIVILNSTVFTLQNAEVRFHNEDGSWSSDPPENFNSGGLIEDFLGRNIFFLSKSDLIASIESKEEYSNYYVVGVVMEFPNVAAVHLAERVSVFYIKETGAEKGYLLDLNGYVTAAGVSESANYIDISNFSRYIESIEEHTQIQWIEEMGDKFEYMQNSLRTAWLFKYDNKYIPLFLKGFSFTATAEDDDITIFMKEGGEIVIKKYKENFEKKLIKGFTVFNNPTLDVKESIITVDEMGRAKSTPKN